HLMQADAAQLPFESQSFDVVTCKLATHYFPDPLRALGEMVRVCRASGLVALIDRVTCDDPGLCAAHNRLEKLRTPNKVRFDAESDLPDMFARAGTTLVRRELMIQPMGFDEWM